MISAMPRNRCAFTSRPRLDTSGGSDRSIDDNSRPDSDIPGLIRSIRNQVPVPIRGIRFRRHQHYTYSVALGLSVACGEQVLFVSHDMIVPSACLSTLLSHAVSRPEIGILRPVSRHMDYASFAPDRLPIPVTGCERRCRLRPMRRKSLCRTIDPAPIPHRRRDARVTRRHQKNRRARHPLFRLYGRPRLRSSRSRGFFAGDRARCLAPSRWRSGAARKTSNSMAPNLWTLGHRTSIALIKPSAISGATPFRRHSRSLRSMRWTSWRSCRGRRFDLRSMSRRLVRIPQFARKSKSS